MDLMKGFQQWCIETTKGRNGGRASGESVNKKVECTLKCIKCYLVGNGHISGSQFADIQIEPLKEINIDDEIALGFSMSHKCWIGIKFNSDMPDNKIFELVRQSYELVKSE